MSLNVLLNLTDKEIKNDNKYTFTGFFSLKKYIFMKRNRTHCENEAAHEHAHVMECDEQGTFEIV